MRVWLLYGCVVALSIVATVDGGFLVPPDPQSGENPILEYAFGDFINARWLCDSNNITLVLLGCLGLNYDKNWTILENVKNDGEYRFQFNETFYSDCGEYIFRLFGDITEGETPMDSANFQLINSTNPSSTLGLLIENVSFTYISTFVQTFSSSVTNGIKAVPSTVTETLQTTFETTLLATASYEPLSSAPNNPKSTASKHSSTNPTSTSNSDPAANTSGLTAGAKIGLGIGLGVGIPVLAAIGAFCLIALPRRRQKRAAATADTYGIAVNHPKEKSTLGTSS